jgi:DNA-directed RNA polymerase specialized sigma24 family protein
MIPSTKTPPSQEIKLRDRVNSFLVIQKIPFINADEFLLQVGVNIKEFDPSRLTLSELPLRAPILEHILFSVLSRFIYSYCVNKDSPNYENAWNYVNNFVNKRLTRDQQLADYKEDLRQDVMVRIYNQINKVDSPEYFFQQIQKILKYTTIDFYRRYNQKTQNISLDLIEEVDDGISKIEELAPIYEDDSGGIESAFIETELLRSLQNKLTPLELQIVEKQFNGANIRNITFSSGLARSQVKRIIEHTRNVVANEIFESTPIPIKSRFQIFYNKAVAEELKDKPKMAIAKYYKALKFISIDFLPFELSPEIAKVKFRIAICSKKLGNWTDALQKQFEAAKVFSQLHMHYWKGEAYYQIADIYQMMNIYDYALLYYREAFFQHREAFEKVPPAEKTMVRKAMAKALVPLGKLEFQLNITNPALEHLCKASEIYEVLKKTNEQNEILQIINTLKSIAVAEK